MVTVILLATLLTFMISLGPGAYKLMTTSVEDKLRTDANVMALEGWGKRAQRAMDNHLETYISFMALAVLAVYLGDRVGVDDIKRVALAGGWLYLISRVVHWLCFLAAVPYVRTAAYAGSILGIVIVGWSVFRLAPI